MIVKAEGGVLGKIKGAHLNTEKKTAQKQDKHKVRIAVNENFINQLRDERQRWW